MGINENSYGHALLQKSVTPSMKTRSLERTPPGKKLDLRPCLHVTEQRLCDQVRMIRKNGWLTESQLADIRNSQRLVNTRVEKNGDPEIYFW